LTLKIEKSIGRIISKSDYILFHLSWPWGGWFILFVYLFGQFFDR